MDYRWEVTNIGRRSPGRLVPMVAQIHRRNVDIVSLAKAMRARLKIIGHSHPIPTDAAVTFKMRGPPRRQAPRCQESIRLALLNSTRRSMRQCKSDHHFEKLNDQFCSSHFVPPVCSKHRTSWGAPAEAD